MSFKIQLDCVTPSVKFKVSHSTLYINARRNVEDIGCARSKTRLVPL